MCINIISGLVKPGVKALILISTILKFSAQAYENLSCFSIGIAVQKNGLNNIDYFSRFDKIFEFKPQVQLYYRIVIT